MIEIFNYLYIYCLGIRIKFFIRAKMEKFQKRI